MKQSHKENNKTGAQSQGMREYSLLPTFFIIASLAAFLCLSTCRPYSCAATPGYLGGISRRETSPLDLAVLGHLRGKKGTPRHSQRFIQFIKSGNTALKSIMPSHLCGPNAPAELCPL